jgi:hypothetical protein
LKKGDVTAVVETPLGYWVLFAEDTKPGKNVSLEEATQEVASVLARKDKAGQYAKTVAKELLATAQKDAKKSLRDVVRSWNNSHRPKAASAPEATPGGPSGDEPPAKEEPKAEKKEGDTEASRIPLDESADTEEEAEQEPFDGMLEVLESAPIARANNFPNTFEYAREQDDLYRDEDDRNKFDTDDDSWAEVLGLGRSKELKTGVFGLTKDNPVYPSVFNPGETQKHFVIRLKEKNAPQGDEATEARTRVRRQLLARRQREAYRAFYVQLKERAIEAGILKYSATWDDLLTQEWQAFQRRFVRAQGAR